MSMKTRLFTVAFASALAVTVQTEAAIVYVDAAATNTTVTDSGGSTSAMIVEPDSGFNVGDDAGNGSDGLWSFRTYANGNGGSILQAHNTEGVTDTLNTTVSGLTNGEYHVYAYFWALTSSWDIAVDLNGGTVIDVEGGDTGTVLSSSQTFTTAVSTADGATFNMYAVDLGTFTGTAFTVGVDQGSGSGRTWYDGVGYELVELVAIPTPAALPAGLMMLGTLAIRRRRK